MRTSYTVHHTLTTEATTIVKQAISLARRRGHAQVTPLHVASAMLGSSTGLLRSACLQSHSHPLQCKALELCFNVALNRLPTASGSGPILAPHSHHLNPSFSNALVAAFKRAQAHQRRGSVESQQQPILALKVELEQLVISILDDPSVSRVMREAGFSSPQVKANVEQAVSLEICSRSPPSTSVSRQSEGIRKSSSVLISNNVSLFHSMNEFRATLKNDEQVRSQDVTSVLESLMSKKMRNIAIVGECLASAEGVVRGVIDKFNRGEVQGDMKCVQFISLPIFSLKSLPVEEVEQKVGELRCLVKSYVSRGGVVLYLGDLNWVSEFWSNHGQNYYYCPAVKLMIMELSRLLLGGIGGESGKLWVVGIATFHTYMRCKTGQPSLETLWQLHPLTIPVGSLGLSLTLDSDWRGHEFQGKTSGGEESSWSQIKIGAEKNLTCCSDCLANFNREAQSTAMNTYNSNYNESVTASTSSNLPSWLQQYKEENKRKTNNDQELNKLGELCKKWNSICSSVHKQQPHFLEKTLKFSSPSPSSSTTISSSHDLNQTLLNWPVIFKPKGSPKEHQFLIPENDPKVPDLLSNPNSSPNSASSSETNDHHDDVECLHRFKEVNSENLKSLCNALERKVPWQRDVIPDIANTILQCRSGMVGRKDGKEETWMFFLGIDFEGKEKVAKELAKVVFGSRSYFVKIGLTNFFSSAATRADSSEELSKKRARDEPGSSYLVRFAEAVRDNPSRVFFMEDLDLEQVDFCSQKGIKEAIESGRITLDGGDQVVPLKDAIVIFSCDSFSSMSRACSPPTRRKCGDRREEKEDSKDESEKRRDFGSSLDLNVASVEDGNGDHEHSVDYSVAGSVLDSVDRQIFFKVQVL